MKKVWIVAYALLFVSVAGFAQMPSQAPLMSEALAAIFSQPAVDGSCATPQSGVLFAAQRPGTGGEKALCTATVNCGSSTISCQGNSSTATCTAVNRNCPSERGRVTCGGVTTQCPPVCPVCTTDCCVCQSTGDCYACCRCAGHPPIICTRDCG